MFQEVEWYLDTYMPTPQKDGTLRFGGPTDARSVREPYLKEDVTLHDGALRCDRASDARSVKEHYLKEEVTLHGALRCCLAVPLIHGRDLRNPGSVFRSEIFIGTHTPAA